MEKDGPPALALALALAQDYPEGEGNSLLPWAANNWAWGQDLLRPVPAPRRGI